MEGYKVFSQLSDEEIKELDSDLKAAQEESKEKYKRINKKQYYEEETQKVKTRSETIGYILKFLRKEQKLTQKEVAENLGIAQQTYAGYESGKHEPSIEIAIRISDFYGLSLDYITGRFVEPNDKTIDEYVNFDLILRYSLSYYARAEQNNIEQIKLIKKSIKND